MDSLSTLEKGSIKPVEDLAKELPVEHNFSDGVYTRTIFMPAGMLVVGKQHKTTHLNTLIQGSCDVMINGEIRHFKAPCTFESLAGSQKTLYIYEDCLWMTIHTNEDNERDIEILEKRYVENEDTPQTLLWKNIIKTLGVKQ